MPKSLTNARVVRAWACYDCLIHRLDADMWISKACWDDCGHTVTRYENLPVRKDSP